MSIERHQRSTSFHARQKTVKVNHNSKLLPTDFFPKINSQSPKKRAEFPATADVLAEWYERQESKEKPQKQYHRLVHKPTSSRVAFCAVPQPTPVQKQRYILDYYNRMKEHLRTKVTSQKMGDNEQKVRIKRERNFLRRNPSITLRQREQHRIRLIRSESKPKRKSETPESSKKGQLPHMERRSLRELPRRFDPSEVAVGFDGMVTFSRFK